MAISVPTLLTNGGESNAADTEAQTASITPAASSVVFLGFFIFFSAGSATTNPTVAGNGLTWTLVTTQDSLSVRRKLFLFRGVGTPSAGVITITRAAATTWDHISWQVFEHTGANTSAPIVAGNTVGGNQDTGTGATPTHTINYNNAFAAGSAGIAIFANNGGTRTATPRAGWTEIYDAGVSATFGVESQYRLTSDTAGAATWNDDGVQTGIICELAAAAGGSGNSKLTQSFLTKSRLLGRLSYHNHPEISLQAYYRERAMKHNEFMNKVRRAA